MELPEAVDLKHAPFPANDSEQLLFRNFYETLVRVDCRGRVRPGLATAWSAEPAQRMWNFTLRADSFSGATAEEQVERFVSGWERRWGPVTALGVERVSTPGDGRLGVIMRSPLDSVPRIFADPALSWFHELDSLPWVIDRAGQVRSGAVPGHIEFRKQRGPDSRDALDAGADLMVTRDPGVLEYATRQPEFSTTALPWNRTYVLLWPGNPASAPRLLADAVRVEARRAEPPFWWDQLATCAGRSESSLQPPSSRVVYVKGDDVARDLAERIVALVGGGASLRTAGLEPGEFAASLAKGLDRAYVMGLPRQALTPCRESAGWPRGATIQPLIDTRAHAIVRHGSPPLRVDWDGTVRIEETSTGKQ